MPEALLLRLGILLNIHAALRSIHSRDEDMLSWLAGPHRAPPFNGRAPRDVIICGHRWQQEALLRFLQAKTTGLFMAPVDASFELASNDYQITYLDAQP